MLTLLQEFIFAHYVKIIILLLVYLVYYFLEHLILCLVLVYLIYSFVEYNVIFKYWSSKNIPGPVGIPFLGSSHEFIFNSFPEIYGKWIKKYGDVFGIYEAKSKCLVINDADLINDVLVSNFHKFNERRVVLGHWIFTRQLINQAGDDWRSARAIMSPAFSSGKMKRMYPIMKKCYLLLEKEVERVASNGEEVVVKDLFAKLTTSVIAACAFATEVDPYKNETNQLLSSLADWMTFKPLRQFIAVILPGWFVKSTNYSTVSPSTMNYIIGLCRSILKERKSMKNESGECNDLLQLLLEAGNNGKIDEHNNVPDHEAHHVLEDREDVKKAWEGAHKRPFTDDEIIANIVLFWLAGFDTTSTLLTSSSYLLAMYPSIQDKLHLEVKKALEGTDIKDLQYEQLTSMKYLDAFIAEVLRLFPATTRLERIAREDHTFENGIQVERGTIIQIPIYNVHHDPKYFKDAENFDPDRFLPENRGEIKRGSYLPFVIGPKNCIGMRFAMMEAKIALANFILKFKIVPSEKTTNLQVKFKPFSFLLSFAHDVVVKIQPRRE